MSGQVLDTLILCGFFGILSIMKKTISKEYEPSNIEPKWQKEWEKKKVFRASDTSKKQKFYGLMEFPYPSGDGLHTGHVRGYTAMDIISRKKRMNGANVLFPIGWDAFGLPTENYAIKTGIQPAKVTQKNTDNFRKQFKGLGMSFDWSREINTTDPKYYRWTQWIFLQFLKHDLAYKAKININWCPKDKIGLANEEVVNGCCERCGTPVEKREKEQWMLRITKYADKLDRDLDTVDYLEKIKLQQRNWIGRSEGAEIEFALKKISEKIKVFTTRPDTIFGATYVVLAPEHEFVQKLKNQITNWSEVETYISDSKKKAEIERTADEKEKTGVLLRGVQAINPATNEEIPVFIADYVLATYGTGSVMAVPAHDERDFAFAKKYELPIKQVIAPEFGLKRENEEERNGGCGIVFDPKTQKYAVGLQKNGAFRLFSGGVDSGEDIKTGILREVEEESGLYDFKKVEFVGTAYTHYYNSLRKVNRSAWATCFLVILNSTEEKKVHHEEHEDFDLTWVSGKELLDNILAHNGGHDNDHWVWFITNSIARIIELGFDKTSDKNIFVSSSYLGNGLMINSGRFNGTDSEKAKKEITKFVHGKSVTKFKLRDWVFSRQRYWGEPIPVVHCPDCGIVPLKEKDLPLTLPKVTKYEPTDTGESPLASISKWVNIKCPTCGGKAKRETDTMPNWAGSSWYFLRYTDPKNSKKFADMKKMKKWMQVDWYNGGMEHTTLHLLYSRFWNKFLFDIGLVPFSEPYKKRTSHGMILAKGGEKMSKSRGNVVNPDDIVKAYGADTLRMYEMFMGPFDQAIGWDEQNIIGARRFLDRVWRLQFRVVKNTTPDQKFETLLHKTLKKVSDDIEKMGFNTAISGMMIFLNEAEKLEKINKEDFEMFLKILSPFAPHITEEIWHAIGNKTLISIEKWPKADPKKIVETEIKIMIQINGKVRAECSVPGGTAQDEIVDIAKKLPEVDKWLLGKEIKKTIYVANRLVNFVVV